MYPQCNQHLLCRVYTLRTEYEKEERRSKQWKNLTIISHSQKSKQEELVSKATDKVKPSVY